MILEEELKTLIVKRKDGRLWVNPYKRKKYGYSIEEIYKAYHNLSDSDILCQVCKKTNKKFSNMQNWYIKTCGSYSCRNVHYPGRKNLVILRNVKNKF